MKIANVIALVVVLLVGVFFYAGCKPVWQFDHLERNARRAITADELQAWAVNLLAQHPSYTNLSLPDLGTNFPPQLRDLAPKLGPMIVVFEGADSNSPAWVFVHWGSGFLGSHGFEIGPTNFVSGRRSHAWQPGVYFFDQ